MPLRWGRWCLLLGHLLGAGSKRQSKLSSCGAGTTPFYTGRGVSSSSSSSRSSGGEERKEATELVGADTMAVVPT
jgi:hypothetical protein